MSSKLFRFLAALIVIMFIATGLYKSLLSENSESWEKVGFDSLKASMQEGLVDMHWQWQYEGRPESILYESSRTERVVMNAKGWPALETSEESCRAFLDIFAADAVVEVSGLELEVNVVQQLGIDVELLKQEYINDTGEIVDICRYRRLGQKIDYHLGTGNLF
jgi:hypothetical protein